MTFSIALPSSDAGRVTFAWLDDPQALSIGFAGGRRAGFQAWQWSVLRLVKIGGTPSCLGGSLSMLNFAERRRAVRRLALAAAAVTLLALPALAQPMMPDAEMPDPFANSQCAAEPVTGSGPGFSSSRDASEDAARKAWGEKATAIYPEATWEMAKDAGVSCVVQGLYSKCFAQAIPCRPKSGASSDEAASDKAMPEAMGADEAAQAGE